MVIPFLMFSQCSITVTDTARKNDIGYLQFKGSGIDTLLLKKLNKQYGYQQTLLDTYDEAPHEEQELSVKEKTSLIHQIASGKVQSSLATIDYQVDYTKNCLLSFTRMVVPEGKKRVTNSQVSDLGYFFSENYNLRTGKKIKGLSSFLTAEGIKFIQTALQRVMYKRALEAYKDGQPSTCRIGVYTTDEFKTKTYIVSNDPDNIGIYGYKDSIFFYFGFTEATGFSEARMAGMYLGSNDLEHKSTICGGPRSNLFIPWYDLIPYCIQRPDNIILEIAKKSVDTLEKTEWTVKMDIVSLTEFPDASSESDATPVKPYLIRGDKVTALARVDYHLKVKYITKDGKELRGWVLKDDLE
ncbi:MAG: hypothetical protein JWO06_2163 [Bacteroidota bacterium]|nr:hypothetical protein [Bacteroidota bacterium]